jgi:hypothetical protein
VATHDGLAECWESLGKEAVRTAASAAAVHAQGLSFGSNAGCVPAGVDHVEGACGIDQLTGQGNQFMSRQ